MSETWDAAGFIASSRYRLAVCKYLSEGGPGLPSEIATDTDLAQPHVSRALSELRDREVVELLVPESQQKGRLYDLTDRGRVALNRLDRGRRAVEIDVVGSDEFPHGQLVDYLETSYDDDVEAVATYDGDRAHIHFFGESPQNVSSEPIALLWSEAAQTGELVDSVDGGYSFTVYGLDQLTLVRIHVEESKHVGVSFDDEADITVRRFVRECEQRARN